MFDITYLSPFYILLNAPRLMGTNNFSGQHSSAHYGLDENKWVLFIPEFQDPYRNAPKQPEPPYTTTSLVIE
jgi:hypothetical protein